MFKAIYIDFDGCLADVIPGSYISLTTVNFIRRINDISRHDKSVPFIAINSGRPMPFIEAYAQVLHIYNYSIFENGAGIFKFHNSILEYILDERIPETIDKDFLYIHHRVENKFKVKKQPGKEYTLTYLFDKNDPLIHKVAPFIESVIEENNLPYYTEVGVNFININVKGLDKGTGLELVMKKIGLKPSEIAGIGDSDADLTFLGKCGFKACPSNASESVKSEADYIAKRPFGEGTVEIIEYLLDYCGIKLRKKEHSRV